MRLTESGRRAPVLKVVRWDGWTWPACSSAAIWRVTAAICSLRCLFVVSTPVTPRMETADFFLPRDSLMSVTNSESFLSLTRASRGVSASMMPFLTRLSVSIALYSKIGMGA